MVLSVLKHLLDPCLWRLTGRVLWNCLLRVSVAPWKLLALMLIEEEEKRSKKKFNHDCSKHDQNRLTYELVSSDPNQANFTRLHAYGIDDLVDFVIRTCCRDDQAKLTETQRHAKEEFIKVFSSDTTDFSEDQLVYLMGLLDKIFFAGSLTQRQPGLVKFEIIPFDPWAWNRVRWRLQEPDFLAYTDYAQPLSKDTLIAMSRVSGGRRFTRTQMITILSHEMCHSFIALYWDWCPEEKKVYVENTMNSHGEAFHTMCNEIHRTIDQWHPDLDCFGDTEIKEPIPGPWLTRTKMIFKVLEKVQRRIKKVIRWHTDRMVTISPQPQGDIPYKPL